MIHTIKDIPYRKRLEHLRLPSLKYRRLRGDLIQVYNLFKTDSFYKFFTLNTHDTTRDHNFKIYKKLSKTNTRKHSFSNRPRIVNTWNNLSHHTVKAQKVDSFKKFLDGDLFNQLYIFD